MISPPQVASAMDYTHMSHSVTLKLELTISRDGMADVTEQIIDAEVDRMVSAIGETFPVDSVKREYSVKRPGPYECVLK